MTVRLLRVQAEWHSSTVAVKMLKRSDSIAMNDFRTELDVLQKVCHRAVNILIQWGGAMARHNVDDCHR